MKKLFILFSFIALTLNACAQDKPINPDIPPFRILTTDSAYFTPAKLKKNTKVIIVYFSPDCPHCQHLVTELKPKMNELGDTQVILITWSANFDLRAIKTFNKEYKLGGYPNIIIGTEGYTYLVQKYYNVLSTPFIAIYNRKGKMVQSFSKPPKIDDVIAAVKKA
jgi:thioredoxin-related protein